MMEYTYDELKRALVEGYKQKRPQRELEIIAKKIENREYKGESNDLWSAALGASQGATLGFGDEMWAGARAGFDKLLSGQDFGEAYDQRLAENRKALEVARREDPWITGLSELAGGMVTGGTGMARTVAGKGLAKAMGTGALTGGGIGGLAGYGYSESDPLASYLQGDSKEELAGELGGATEDVLIGGSVGGFLGGTLPAAGDLVKRLGRMIFTRQGGRMNEANRMLVARAIDDDINAGHITKEQAIRELEQNPDMFIGDLGPNTRRLMESVMHSGTKAGTNLDEFVRNRNREQWVRMHPRITEALGSTEQTFAKAHRALIEGMKKRSDKAYKKAHVIEVEMTPAMRNILDFDHFKGIETAAQIAKQGDMIAEGFKKNQVARISLDTGMMTGRDADYILRAMDSKVKSLYSQTDNADAMAAAKVAKRLRNQFREMVYLQNKPLKQARNLWSDDKATEEALQKGKDLLNPSTDFEDVGHLVGSMTDGQKVQFKIGVTKAIINKLANKPDDADIIKGVFNVEAKRQAIREAFGDMQAFERFMEYVKKEKKMFETFQKSTGSATHRRDAEAVHLMDQMAKLGGYALGLTAGGYLPPSMTGFLAGKASQSVRKAFPAVSDADLYANMARHLQSRDLNTLMQPTATQGLMATGAPVSVSRLTGGLLSSGLLQQDPKYGSPFK